MHRFSIQVQSVSGSENVFTALLSDGTVDIWGTRGAREHRLYKPHLAEVVLICASAEAFAVLRKDGTVDCWGNYFVEPQKQKELVQVVAISSTSHAFAALRRDGSVVTWGLFLANLEKEESQACWAGTASLTYHESKPVSALKGVVAIRGTKAAFAALEKDGTVTTWGHKEYGGDSSAVQGELIRVVSISASSGDFAALRRVTWGIGGSGVKRHGSETLDPVCPCFHIRE